MKLRMYRQFLEGEDGTLSTSKLAALLGVVLIIHIWIDQRYLGFEYSASALAFWLEIIMIALGLRGLDRFSRYGLTDMIGNARINRKKTAPEIEAATPHPPKAERSKSVKHGPLEAEAPKAAAPKSGNFTLEEFNSKDGAPMPPHVKRNITKLIKNLEIIREACGNRVITISSGYRSPEHNAAVEGASDSYHMQGKAADIKVKGMRPAQVSDIIKQLMDEGRIMPGGLKAYKTFTHYDIRGTYTTWKN
jgi:hypothetical protein